MRERFAPLPNGPFRISRGYQQRVQGAVERASRFPMPAPFPGLAGSGPYGPFLAADMEGVVWAELVTAPDDTHMGWSWRERWPDAGGTWAEPEAPLGGDNGADDSDSEADATLAGRSAGVVTITTAESHGFTAGGTVTVDLNVTEFNGTFVIDAVTDTTFTYTQAGADHDPAGVSGTATSTSSFPRQAPAFDPSGQDGFQVGDIVALARGFLHTGTTDWADLGHVGGDPALGPDLDADAKLGQEWLILGGAGGGAGGVRRLRIIDRPYSVGGVMYYPAFLRQRKDDGTVVDVPEGSPKLVYVQCEYEQPLGTTGTFVVWGRREGTVAIPDDPEGDPMGDHTTYECWVTRDHLCLVKVECVDGILVNTWDGKFEGEDETPGLDFSREGNSMYVGMFG